MRNAKDKIFHLEEKVSYLTTENEKLAIRAAASFEELTPRPSFQKVYFFNCLTNNYK